MWTAVDISISMFKQISLQTLSICTFPVVEAARSREKGLNLPIGELRSPRGEIAFLYSEEKAMEREEARYESWRPCRTWTPVSSCAAVASRPNCPIPHSILTFIYNKATINSICFPLLLTMCEAWAHMPKCLHMAGLLYSKPRRVCERRRRKGVDQQFSGPLHTHMYPPWARQARHGPSLIWDRGRRGCRWGRCQELMRARCVNVSW